MSLIKIQVLQEHIDGAERDGYNCPISRATVEHFKITGTTKVTTIQRDIFFFSENLCVFRLTPVDDRHAEFINKFDGGSKVEPIEIEYEMVETKWS